MPDYADDFYQWLADNSNSDGALVDPALESTCGDGYCYVITTIKQTVAFEYEEETQDSIIDGMVAAVQDAMAENYEEVKLATEIAFYAFDRDYPEVFWLSGSVMTGYGSSSISPDNYGNGEGEVSFSQVMYYYLTAPSYGYDSRKADYTDVNTLKSEMAF